MCSHLVTREGVHLLSLRAPSTAPPNLPTSSEPVTVALRMGWARLEITPLMVGSVILGATYGPKYSHTLALFCEVFRTFALQSALARPLQATL